MVKMQSSPDSGHSPSSPACLHTPRDVTMRLSRKPVSEGLYAPPRSIIKEKNQFVPDVKKHRLTKGAILAACCFI